MEQFDSIEAVLKRAIQLEVEAMTLYSNAAQSVKDDAVRAAAGRDGGAGARP